MVGFRCCYRVELAGGCQDQEFEVETAPVQFTCDAGCTYDLKNDKCLCSAGTVAECPSGLSKCSIAGGHVIGTVSKRQPIPASLDVQQAAMFTIASAAPTAEHSSVF